MGEFATYVGARTRRPVESIGSLGELTEGAVSSQEFGAWVSSVVMEEELYLEADTVLAELREETGAGAMVGQLIDSDCLWVAAVAADGVRFQCCLARGATRDYLEEDDLDIDSEFLDPAAGVVALSRWSEGAGLEADTGTLAELLGFEEFPNEGGPDYWSQLLIALGLSAEHAPA